jgi:hypothetical protein
MNKTVSMLTVTQLSRSHLFPNLIELVKRQDYKNIIQWVIVEGSQNYKDAEKNEQLIFDEIAKHNFSFEVLYVSYEGYTFSQMLNVGNLICTGDVITIFEDDDFYPSTRISHSVEMLNTYDCEIVGCSGIYIYDCSDCQFYKFKTLNPFHSCNNAFSYTKNYANTHKFSPIYNNEFCVESPFTKNFSEKMAQLLSEFTIIHFFHDANTYNKLQHKSSWIRNETMIKIEKFPLNINEKNAFDNMARLFK